MEDSNTQPHIYQTNAQPTNSCFVIIPTHLGLYSHAPWSSILLK